MACACTRETDGLPAGFRYHDLRHYVASLLIAPGADVKTVQARLRHASAVLAGRAEQERNSAAAR